MKVVRSRSGIKGLIQRPYVIHIGGIFTPNVHSGMLIRIRESWCTWIFMRIIAKSINYNKMGWSDSEFHTAWGTQYKYKKKNHFSEQNTPQETSRGSYLPQQVLQSQAMEMSCSRSWMQESLWKTSAGSQYSRAGPYSVRNSIISTTCSWVQVHACRYQTFTGSELRVQQHDGLQ